MPPRTYDEFPSAKNYCDFDRGRDRKTTALLELGAGARQQSRLRTSLQWRPSSVRWRWSQTSEAQQELQELQLEESSGWGRPGNGCTGEIGREEGGIGEDVPPKMDQTSYASLPTQRIRVAMMQGYGCQRKRSGGDCAKSGGDCAKQI